MAMMSPLGDTATASAALAVEGSGYQRPDRQCPGARQALGEATRPIKIRSPASLAPERPAKRKRPFVQRRDRRARRQVASGAKNIVTDFGAKCDGIDRICKETGRRAAQPCKFDYFISSKSQLCSNDLGILHRRLTSLSRHSTPGRGVRRSRGSSRTARSSVSSPNSTSCRQ
jgi:hypothetical protein